MANDAWDTVIHSGIATFMNRPYLKPNRDIIKENKVKAGTLGLPFDGTTITRTGSTMGPRRFRDVSSMNIPYHFDYDVDIVEAYNIHDFGDAHVQIGNAHDTLQHGKEDILEILHGGAMPILIGGEHLVTVAATKAIEEFDPNGKYGFILFDAHLDTAPDIGGDIWNHCCPVPRTMELSCFNPENAVIIGPHGALNPKEELKYVQDNDISLYTMRDIYRDGIQSVVKKAIETASDGTDGVYITFDMDSLDASQTPGTCAPTPGGITAREMIQAIDLLGEVDLVGFDIVEIAPPYDHGDITAITAARMAVDMLASRARYLK